MGVLQVPLVLDTERAHEASINANTGEPVHRLEAEQSARGTRHAVASPGKAHRLSSWVELNGMGKCIEHYRDGHMHGAHVQEHREDSRG